MSLLRFVGAINRALLRGARVTVAGSPVCAWLCGIACGSPHGERCAADLRCFAGACGRGFASLAALRGVLLTCVLRVRAGHSFASLAVLGECGGGGIASLAAAGEARRAILMTSTDG